MSLAELLPEIRSLSRTDKARLIQVLAEQLEKDEALLDLVKPGESYPVFSPDDAFEAAATMLELLETHKAN